MSKFSVRKPLTIFMAVIAAIVLGVVSYTRMTPDLMPSIDLPYVVIVTSYPGATPEKVETVISKPIEQAMGTLNGIVSINSTSSENASMVMLEFEEETNMDSATVDILQSLNQIEGYWDDEMIGTPYLMKLNPNMMPVAVVGVRMEGMDKSELSNFLDETLLNRLEGIDGVASIATSGNVNEKVSVLLSQSKIDALYEDIYASIDKNFEEPQKELDDGRAALEETKATLDEAQAAFDEALAGIDADPDLPDAMKPAAKEQITSSAEYMQVAEGLAQVEEGLAGLDAGQEELDKAKEEAHKAVDLSALLSMDTISGILTAQSFSMPAGYVYQDNAGWMINVGDEISSIEEIQGLVLADLGMEGLDPIKLEDVADVVFTDDSAEIYAKMDGEDGIMLVFSKQSSYATADVSDSIQQKFKELKDEYEGLEFVTLMDQGDYIHLVVDSITSSLLWGALFAIIVLFIFLRDIRPTFITLFSIPVSVLFAIVLMYFSGITLNMMSLSGLAIAVGMLVDNSIVVIENVYRLRSQGESAAKAAISGAAQVTGAIAASTLTTICVFLPIVFVEGLTRTLFVDMALTLGYALIASLIIAVTFVPAMSSKVLKNLKTKEPKQGGILDKYKSAVTWCLSHKAVVFLLALVLLGGSIYLEISKGYTFMPEMDMPQLSATLETEIGTPFEDTTALADEAIKRIQTVDEVETIGTMISSGTSLMGGGGDNSVTFYIMLKEDKERSAKEITDEINELCADLGGNAEYEFEAAGAMDMSTLMGGSGISVSIYGDDLDVLRETAQEISDIIEGVEGTQNIVNGLEENDPALKITVDKEKAMLNNLTVAQVFMEISNAVTTEKKAIDVIFDTASYEVYISNEDTDALTPDDIRDYVIETTAPDGTTSEVKLKDIASIEDTEALSSISRRDQKRYLTVSAEIADGYNVSLVAADVEDALDGYDMPAGTELEISGENENIEESMIELVKMMLLGVMLVYMIMVSQFQSLKSPFIVMFTIPLAFTGGMLGLLISGFEISVISMLGFVMLCGIIVNNGIVLVDYINQLRIEGMERRKAIAEAGATRMRPIFMTSITTILGLIVMALGVGNGAEMMQPIAIVCIGGLVYATILTLFIIPCLYDLMNKKDIQTISEEDMEISKL